MWMKRRVAGSIPEQSFTVMSLFVMSGEGRLQSMVRSWVNGLEERCVKEGGKER